MAGPSKLRGCPREGVADHMTEGKYKYQGRERHKAIGETEIVRVTRWFRETVCV